MADDTADELKRWEQNAPNVSTIKRATVWKTLPQDRNPKGTIPIDPARKKPMVVKRIHKESYDPIATDKLMRCVRHRDIHEVRRLLEQGTDPNKDHVLSEAVWCCDTAIIQLLLENGADPNKDDVVDDAVCRGDTATLQLLLENGADPNKGNVLWDAVRRCDTAILHLLLENGADPNKDHVLSEAVWCCDTAIIQLLLENGADPNKDDVVDDAVCRGDTATLQLLLENGADPNKTNTLQQAVSQGHVDIVDVLLEGGVDPNQVKDFELIHAAMKGHIDTVEKLLEQGAVQKTFALRGAASSGHIDIVKLLLDKGADPNETFALRGAASSGHIDIVKLLLDKGADPNKTGALREAAARGYTDIVKLLLDKGADPNETGALREAAARGYTDIVKLLLDKGACPNETGALREAAARGYTDIVKLLLDKGACPNETFALRGVASSGHIDIVKLLLDKRADPNKTGALREAAARGYTDIVKLLLDKGADPNETGALREAAARGYTDIVKLLLDKGADPNETFALRGAASSGHIDIVKLLLDKGADSNKTGALREAAARGYTDIVKILLDKGTDPDKTGALREAEARGYTEIVKLRLDKGTDPDKTGALREAEARGYTEIVKLLLDKGTDPDKTGALREAEARGYTEIVKLLLDKGTDPDKSTQAGEELTSRQEVCTPEMLNSLPEPTRDGKGDAGWIVQIVKNQNIEDFKKKVTIAERKCIPSISVLHIVAVYGSTEMVECMKNWTGIDWDEECDISNHVFGESLEGLTVRKATALYLATFMDRTEIVSSLIKCAGEENIRCSFRNLQLSKSMKDIFMLDLAVKLKEKHSELDPAVIPGHRIGKDGKREPVFIVYSADVKRPTSYHVDGRGLVMIRNPYFITGEWESKSERRVKVANCDTKKAQKALSIYRNALWEKHSNLNIIRIMSVNKSEESTEKPCVVLFCSMKGVVPLGEPDFPKQLDIEDGDSVDVIVREGYFRRCGYETQPADTYHSTLKMGCNIGRLTSEEGQQNLSGTLGPFVMFNGKLGFLTCAHVLFDIPSTPLFYSNDGICDTVKVAQPSIDTTTCSDAECGAVHKAIFNPDLDIGIDVAVVELTNRIPRAGQFANASHRKLKRAGFDELPEYNSGNPQRDMQHFCVTHTTVKFGSASDVTRGGLDVNGTDVRTLSHELKLPGCERTVPMKKQCVMYGLGPAFALPGDSGAAVFMKTPGTGELYCIGIVIGEGYMNIDEDDTQIKNYPVAVVTPIGAVLDALGDEYTLASFP